MVGKIQLDSTFPIIQTVCRRAVSMGEGHNILCNDTFFTAGINRISLRPQFLRIFAIPVLKLILLIAKLLDTYTFDSFHITKFTFPSSIVLFLLFDLQSYLVKKFGNIYRLSVWSNLVLKETMRRFLKIWLIHRKHFSTVCQKTKTEVKLYLFQIAWHLTFPHTTLHLSFFKTELFKQSRSNSYCTSQQSFYLPKCLQLSCFKKSNPFLLCSRHRGAVESEEPLDWPKWKWLEMQLKGLWHKT